MRVAVAASSKEPEAAVDPRFGRCPYFVLVDTDTGSVEAWENAATAQGSGAGFAAAQSVADHGADAVVAGNYGPNAFRALSAGGLRLFSAANMTVQAAAEAAAAGELDELGGASVESHFGLRGQ
jgi:predicted Fe-Mo cluster-binding NifX family protein